MKERLYSVILLLFAATIEMTTCSCVGGPTAISKAKSRFELVALALCETVQSDTVKGNGMLKAYKGKIACLKARMCVVVHIKGVKRLTRFDVITEVGKGSCGVDFQVGKTYYLAGDILTRTERIWTTSDDSRFYFIHKCSGSREATPNVIDTLITICR